MNIDELTEEEKRELREVFCRAQDLIQPSYGVCNVLTLINYLDGGSYNKNTMAQKYFELLFKPKHRHRAYWMADMNEDSASKNVYLRRLMALQLAELSLS